MDLDGFFGKEGGCGVSTGSFLNGRSRIGGMKRRKRGSENGLEEARDDCGLCDRYGLTQIGVDPVRDGCRPKNDPVTCIPGRKHRKEHNSLRFDHQLQFDRANPYIVHNRRSQASFPSMVPSPVKGMRGSVRHEPAGSGILHGQWLKIRKQVELTYLWGRTINVSVWL